MANKNKIFKFFKIRYRNIIISRRSMHPLLFSLKHNMNFLLTSGKEENKIGNTISEIHFRKISFFRVKQA